MKKELFEMTTPSAFPEVKIDRDKGMLVGMTLLGPRSENGRKYSERAMESAARLYEGASYYVDHPSEIGDSRSIRDLAGQVLNVRRENYYIRGDVQLLKGTATAEMIFGIAESMPTKAGNSHRILASITKEKDGSETVEDVDHVYGVELVTDPATTRGLFESVKRTPAGEEEDIVDVKELREKYPDLIKVIESDQLAVIQTQKDRIETLETKVTESEKVATDAARKVLIEGKIKGLPEKAVTDRFRKTLTEAKDEAEVDEIIADLKGVLESAGVKVIVNPEKNVDDIVKESVDKPTDEDVVKVAGSLFM